jgi:myo-inositol 2-dehydrogenase / D-chiro-inositol 1-dehydrogenase
MRVALIGVGRIGMSHAEVLQAHPDVTDLVITDVDAARARTVADKLGATAVGTVDEALRGVDAVMIAAPTDAHAELIVRGARAGLPVFCEKPVALDVPSTLAVLEAVREAGVAVHVGFQRRFDAGYLRARQALRDGELGDLHRVHLVTADPEPPHPAYVPLSGGIFRDCHIHDFDILRWVTGREVVEVYATGSNRGAGFFADAGDVDNAAALLRMDDDVLVTVQGSRYNGGGYDVRMELAGSRASWVVGLDERTPMHSAELGVDFPTGQPWPNFWERFTPAYVAEVNAFIELARGRIASPCTVAEALEALYIAEAADRSRRERRPVRLDEVRP